jgi:hypothetical protein
MANELQFTLRATWNLGTVEGSLPAGFAEALGRDVAGTKILHNVQAIGVPQEDLFLGDVGIGGYCFFRNNHGSATIKVGMNGDTLVRLLPGDIAMLRVDPANPKISATEADAELEYWLLEA